VKSTNQFERYLGLPALIGSSKVEAFSGLQGKIWGRINGWKEKFLSQAGKEVLLKAVIQSIPTYTMSVFQLPKSVCKDINSMMSNFWWGQKEKEAKIASMSWEKLGRPKENGGMGYRDLASFNLALLAKQGWRLLKHPESLVARVFRQKYFPNDSFLNSSLGRNPSYVWRSVWNAKRLLNDGLIWIVGNGDSIKIWGDRWIPSPSIYTIQTPPRIVDRHQKVSSLIDVDTKWWNVPLIRELFCDKDAALICNIPISPIRQQDALVWLGTSNGVFSVKSAYHMAKSKFKESSGSSSNHDLSTQLWKRVWHVKGPSVVRVFLWKACSNILPTKINLHKRGIVEDPLCPICKQEGESVEHILWTCESARDVWAEFSSKLQKCATMEVSFANLFMELVDRLDVDEMQKVAVMARLIWFRRNSVVFGGDFMSPKHILEAASSQLENFSKAEA
jgi:hypothetical protein